MCEMPISGINSLLLDCVCWDKDRFSKDYMGEFEIALEEIFCDGKTEQPAKWYALKSKSKNGKKASIVSGEVQLQFTMYDSSTPGSTPAQVMEKFWAIAGIDPESITPTKTISNSSIGLSGSLRDEDEYEELDEDEEPSDETEDSSKPEVQEKRRRRMRIRGLKKRKQNQLYNFMGGSDVVGIVFLEISTVTDLPPEKNMTRTSFDMDPFVIASLGKKTYRTRVVRHNLNPVFNEKMIFQVLRNEQQYSISFTVVDRDKLSGNDFIASTSVPIKEITDTAPKADPETGLYELREPTDSAAPKKQRRFKIALSRSTSSQSLTKMGRPSLFSQKSSASIKDIKDTDVLPQAPAPTSNPGGLQPGDPLPSPAALEGSDDPEESGDPDLYSFDIPLKLKNFEKWEEKHSPELHIRAKYLPYPALRQQFWRAMLKQYDTDESGAISKIELSTMLDTLGSTLKDSTIDNFFKRFPHTTNGDANWELTMDEAVICLEDQLKEKPQRSTSDKIKDMLPDAAKNYLPAPLGGNPSELSSTTTSTVATGTSTPAELDNTTASGVEHLSVDDLGAAGEEGDYLDQDDLNDRGEEHVVEIRECPMCHQPRLNKRSDTDIITHIATCASQDWRQVNSIVMGGFVTSSQAQRKWYSKVITKISHGSYKLGANSANILVQDRLTGQINEERMSIYVRLGIRLLYKGLKSREMEKKRSRSNLDLSLIYIFLPRLLLTLSKFESYFVA